jgi:hypothetical protein
LFRALIDLTSASAGTCIQMQPTVVQLLVCIAICSSLVNQSVAASKWLLDTHDSAEASIMSRYRHQVRSCQQLQATPGQKCAGTININSNTGNSNRSTATLQPTCQLVSFAEISCALKGQALLV